MHFATVLFYTDEPSTISITYDSLTYTMFFKPFEIKKVNDYQSLLNLLLNNINTIEKVIIHPGHDDDIFKTLKEFTSHNDCKLNTLEFILYDTSFIYYFEIQKMNDLLENKNINYIIIHFSAFTMTVQNKNKVEYNIRKIKNNIDIKWLCTESQNYEYYEQFNKSKVKSIC